jgi:hypothetical protein
VTSPAFIVTPWHTGDSHADAITSALPSPFCTVSTTVPARFPAARPIARPGLRALYRDQGVREPRTRERPGIGHTARPGFDGLARGFRAHAEAQAMPVDRRTVLGPDVQDRHLRERLQTRGKDPSHAAAGHDQHLQCVWRIIWQRAVRRDHPAISYSLPR